MEMNIGGENVKKQQLAIMEEDEDGMSVPNWLIDVLKWITRIELANSSLSFSCKMFNRICWPKLHENVKVHIVPDLIFSNESNNFGNICRKLKDWQWQIIPIAAVPPPEYIHSFGTIIIRFLDNQVIEFFKNIALKKIILSMKTSMQKWQEDDEQHRLMRNLLMILANNIFKLQISNYLDVNRFLDFNRQFSTFIDQMAYLDVRQIADLDLDILFNWLMKPLTDGKQKILRYEIKGGQAEYRFINRIKEEFLHSTERRNFLVKLENQNCQQCFLQNEQTEEVLNLYRESHSSKFLARYPKGEEYWKERNVGKFYEEVETKILLDIDEIKKK